MGREKLSFKLKTRSELLKNLAGRYSDFDLQAVELSARIHTVAQSLDAVRNETLEQHGLSQGKLYVLLCLLNEELMRKEKQGPSEIAEGLGVTPATVTGLLDGLERDAFIERHPHRQDRRALTIQLTDQSRRFLDDYMPIQSRQLNDCFSGLAGTEVRTLMTLLNKISLPPKGRPSGGGT